MRRLPPLLAAALLIAGCGGAKPTIAQRPETARIGDRSSARFGSIASPFVGEAFSATTGKWRNTPTSYAYQWERCASGTCSAISGATSNSYTVATADEGHKLRVSVVASNGFGSSAPAYSSETGEVPGESFSCTIEVAASEEGKLQEKIEGVATGGGTVCLKSGTFSLLNVGLVEHAEKPEAPDTSHTGYVVVRPAAGATVTLEGVHVNSVKYLAIEHFGFTSSGESNGSVMTEGVYVENITIVKEPGGAHVSPAKSEHLKVNYDRIEDPSCNSGYGCPGPEYGVFLGKGPGEPVEHVQVDHDYLRHINLGGSTRLHEGGPSTEEEHCSAGVSTGQDATMEEATYVELEYDTFYLVQGHYLQDGSHVTVKHDDFFGHWELNVSYCAKSKCVVDKVEEPCGDYHSNIWELYAGGEEDNVFSDNVAVGEEPNENGGVSAEAILSENGPGGGTCADYQTNFTMENDLLVSAAKSSFSVQLYYIAGHTIYHDNTVAVSAYGTLVGGEDGPGGKGCSIGEGEITNNIGIETSGGKSLNLGCAGTLCVINENVADDTSTSGETTKVQNWKPAWVSSTSCDTPIKAGSGCWDPYKELEEGRVFLEPPSGYYVASGLSFTAGYQGGGGS